MPRPGRSAGLSNPEPCLTLPTRPPSLSLWSISARSVTSVTGKESQLPRGAKGAKPAKAKVEAKLSVARTSPKTEGSRVGNLEEAFGGAEAGGSDRRNAARHRQFAHRRSARFCHDRAQCGAAVWWCVMSTRPGHEAPCPASSPRGLAGSPPAARPCRG